MTVIDFEALIFPEATDSVFLQDLRQYEISKRKSLNVTGSLIIALALSWSGNDKIC